MPYNQNDPNYQTKNSRISSFNDFNLNIDKEKAELKKMKMSTIKNDSELHRIPGNRKFKFNKVTHKIDDISPDEINDKLDSIEDMGLEDGNHKYKISESKSSKHVRLERRENKTYAFVEVSGDSKSGKDISLSPLQRIEIEKILNK